MQFWASFYVGGFVLHWDFSDLFVGMSMLVSGDHAFLSRIWRSCSLVLALTWLWWICGYVTCPCSMHRDCTSAILWGSTLCVNSLLLSLVRILKPNQSTIVFLCHFDVYRYNQVVSLWANLGAPGLLTKRNLLLTFYFWIVFLIYMFPS